MSGVSPLGVLPVVVALCLMLDSAAAGSGPVIRTFVFPKEAYRDSPQQVDPARIPLPVLRVAAPVVAADTSTLQGVAADAQLHDHEVEQDDETIVLDEHGHPAYIHDLELIEGAETRVERVQSLDRLDVARLDGTPINLNDMLVPGTIVHFWASWCLPCAEELPELEAFYRGRIAAQDGSRGIRLIAISNDAGSKPATRFLEAHGTTFPVFLDKEQKSNLALVGQRALPATVLVGAGGRLHRLALGKFDWKHEGLLDILGATAEARPRSRLER